jgi:hypothetical protein
VDPVGKATTKSIPQCNTDLLNQMVAMQAHKGHNNNLTNHAQVQAATAVKNSETALAAQTTQAAKAAYEAALAAPSAQAQGPGSNCCQHSA